MLYSPGSKRYDGAEVLEDTSSPIPGLVEGLRALASLCSSPKTVSLLLFWAEEGTSQATGVRFAEKGVRLQKKHVEGKHLHLLSLRSALGVILGFITSRRSVETCPMKLIRDLHAEFMSFGCRCYGCTTGVSIQYLIMSRLPAECYNTVRESSIHQYARLQTPYLIQ